MTLLPFVLGAGAVLAVATVGLAVGTLRAAPHSDDPERLRARLGVFLQLAGVGLLVLSGLSLAVLTSQTQPTLRWLLVAVGLGVIGIACELGTYRLSNSTR